MDERDLITLIVLAVIAIMIVFYGLQKIAENIAYGWHAGRLRAEREHVEAVEKSRR